jgi:RNA polymerase sigma factor (sigma-70 family)
MTTDAPLQRLVRKLVQAAERQPLERLADAELLDRFRSQKDAEAFATIVRRHGPCVLAACRKVLSSQADVEDAFQATFFVLLRTPTVIRQRTSLRSWLYGVAHRVALKALRAGTRRQRAEQRRPAATADAPDMSWREACGILHEELDRLPDLYRLPLLLCYLDGKSRDEAAEQLGVKTDVLRGRLERGRDRLRARLTRRGVGLSAGLLAAAAAADAALAGCTPR